MTLLKRKLTSIYDLFSVSGPFHVRNYPPLQGHFILDKTPGCHGVEFGLKKGGGYYAYVASKFANDLIVVDMDKLEIAGRILLADPKDRTSTAYNGMGGQGVLPPTLSRACPPQNNDSTFWKR